MYNRNKYKLEPHVKLMSEQIKAYPINVKTSTIQWSIGFYNPWYGRYPLNPCTSA